jgi:hypothetical protein
MNQKIILKSILLAAGTFGFAAAVHAEEPAPVPVSGTLGLLGQAYAGLSYSYVNLDRAPVNAATYGVEYNQPLVPGYDVHLGYDWTQSGILVGDRAHERTLEGTVRAFNTTTSWGRPYFEAGVGYDWLKYAGVKDSSFLWIAGAGVEFQVKPALTVTPYVRWKRAGSYADRNSVSAGVKANFWLNKQWALTGGLSRNDDDDTAFTVGTNFRF